MKVNTAGRNGIPLTKDRIEFEFYDRVSMPQGTECWLWKGSKYPNGYGNFRLGGHGRPNFMSALAHRLSFEIHNEVKLTPETYVCHKCDNPACVNPFHLFLGDSYTNQLDCVRKGRGNNRTAKTRERSLAAQRNELGRFT